MTSNNKIAKVFLSLVLLPFVLASLNTYFSDRNIYELGFVNKTTLAFYMYLIALVSSIYIFRIKKEEKYKNWWNLVSVFGIIIFALLAYFTSEFSRFGF